MRLEPFDRRRARGLTLVEMLTALILLGAFALVAARLTTNIMHVSRRSAEAEAGVAALESAVARLRDDVWTAERVETGEGPVVATVFRVGGQSVRWAREDDGSLVRTESDGPGQPQRWPGLGGRLRGEADAAGLTLVDTKAPAGQSTPVRLVSQLQLVRGGK